MARHQRGQQSELVVVDDEAGLTAYLDSEPHKAVYTKWLSWMIDSRQAAQLALPADGAAL